MSKKLETLTTILCSYGDLCYAEVVHYLDLMEKFGLSTELVSEGIEAGYELSSMREAFEFALCTTLSHKLGLYISEDLWEAKDITPEDLFTVKDVSVTFEFRNPDTYEVFEKFEDILEYTADKYPDGDYVLEHLI